MPTPAEKLVGMKLDDGWQVIKRIEPSSDQTGGTFSCSYVVKNNSGEQAFLKALDYSRALKSEEPAKRLKELTDAFLFEIDILEKCKEKKMSKVVKSITHGKVQIDHSSVGVVEYIIFELADKDIRTHLNFSNQFDMAWALRALHNITIGIRQLHSAGIAHQDIKPSNVLVFNDKLSKLTDIGRAAYQGETPPHEKYPVAGDPAYAPLELLYKKIPEDWIIRRMGCDVYLLGSMVVFLITGVSMNGLIDLELDEIHNWNNWSGKYDDVMPYVRQAFNEAIINFGKHINNEELREKLKIIVRQLCDPDPYLRGHPKSKTGYQNPCSVDRYIATFDILARKVEAKLFQGL